MTAASRRALRTTTATLSAVTFDPPAACCWEPVERQKMQIVCLVVTFHCKPSVCKWGRTCSVQFLTVESGLRLMTYVSKSKYVWLLHEQGPQHFNEMRKLLAESMWGDGEVVNEAHMSFCAEDWVRGEEEMVSRCELSEDSYWYKVDVVCVVVFSFEHAKFLKSGLFPNKN